MGRDDLLVRCNKTIKINHKTNDKSVSHSVLTASTKPSLIKMPNKQFARLEIIGRNWANFFGYNLFL